MRRTERFFRVTFVFVAFSTATCFAMNAPPPSGDAKPIRKPVQDLAAEAKRARRGEIVPGSTQPAESATVTPSPAPATPVPAAVIESVPAATESKPVSSEAAPAPKPATNAPSQATLSAPSATRAPRAMALTSPREVTVASARYVVRDALTVQVEAIAGDSSLVQYRLVDEATDAPGAWQAVVANSELRGRIEFRTGASAVVRVRAANNSTCTIGPLTRVLLERRAREDGSESASAFLGRGAIWCAGESVPWVVSTPDGAYSTRSSKFTYDAMTRTQVLPK